MLNNENGVNVGVSSGPDLSFFPTLSSPESPAAIAIRALRASIISRHLQKGRRALAVCSASSNVGCTYVSANLAVSLAQAGIRTLLIDGNIRAPHIGKLFHAQRARSGLRQSLNTLDARFRDFIEFEVLPNLSVLFAGDPSSDDRELLASFRFQNLMHFCFREFDATIVDTPAANESSDATRIASLSSYCLVVARCGQSSFNDIKLLADHLAKDGVSIVGTVLNEY